MANTDKFLDLSTGLPRLWSKIGDKFVAKEQGKGLVAIDTVLDSTSGASDTTVPSTKLMKTQLDLKADASDLSNYVATSAISQSIATDTGSAVKVPSVAAVEGAITAAATPLSNDIATDSASTTKAATAKAVADYAVAKSNISQDISTDTGSTTKVPSVDAVEDAIAAAATPISQSITNDTGSTTKVPSVKAVEDAIDSALSTVYEYKGSVATESLLPTTGVSTGDVYNIVAASSYGEAGMNVAAIVDNNTITWDNLGGSFTIQAISQAEVDAVCV